MPSERTCGPEGRSTGEVTDNRGTHMGAGGQGQDRGCFGSEGAAGQPPPGHLGWGT